MPRYYIHSGYKGEDIYTYKVGQSTFNAMFGTLIEIPEGSFSMGAWKMDSDARENESPEHQLHLHKYYISKAPVTVGEFRMFVAATGYQWNYATNQGISDDHPVVWVSWMDALNYCNFIKECASIPVWRDGILETLGVDNKTLDFRLPSEPEWEKAARGFGGRIYPWGYDPPDHTRCHFNQDGDQTAPVGAHSPQGDSPYGCVDMAGNVGEWTRSLLTDSNGREFRYPYNPADGREARFGGGLIAIRGGELTFDASRVRIAYRYGMEPDQVSSRIGFRFVVIPAGPRG